MKNQLYVLIAALLASSPALRAMDQNKKRGIEDNNQETRRVKPRIETHDEIQSQESNPLVLLATMSCKQAPNKSKIIEYLQELGRGHIKQEKSADKPYIPHQKDLINRLREGNEDEAIKLLRYPLNLNYADIYGNTALHVAASKNQVTIVKQLLAAKADLTATNYWGDTPLHKAAEYINCEIVTLLIKAGSNINITNKYKETALFAAIGCRQSELISILLDAKADPNKANTKGNTPLHKAAGLNEQENIIALLIDAKANLNAINRKKQTPALIAFENGYPNSVAMIIDAGGKITT